MVTHLDTYCNITDKRCDGKKRKIKLDLVTDLGVVER